MKHCPGCNRTYTDDALNFCLEDGTPLVTDGPASSETVRYPAPRDTNPPPTEIYLPTPPLDQAPPPPVQPTPFQPQYSPMPMGQPRRSGALWWILGGLAAVVVLGIGIVVVIIAVASMNSTP